MLNLIVCMLNVLQKRGNKVFLKQHQGTVDLSELGLRGFMSPLATDT